MKNYFLQNKSGDTSRFKCPTFKFEMLSKIKLFLKWVKKKDFFSLSVFDTNLLIFFFFLKKVFWCCHLSSILFITIILYFVHPQKSHCMLAKRKKTDEGGKMYENLNIKKMLRVSWTLLWVACYSNCLCSKVHFLWKESKN